MKIRERSPLLWKQRGYIGIGNRRGVGGSGTWRQRINELMANADLSLENITHTVIPKRGAITPSMTRATTKTIVDSWGRQVTCLAGEVGFPGARRVENLWGATTATLTSGNSNTMTLPTGTYIFSMGAGTGRATFSGTGGATGTLDAVSTGRVGVTKTITAGTLIVTASLATLVDLMVENRTGCSDTTTPSEFVGIGIAASPAYHGSCVDGVKCFPTDLSGNPLPTAATFNAVSLPGVSGSYVSTPDSVANSITGTLDADAFCSANDWTPATTGTFFTKDIGTGGAGSRAYGLYLVASGALVYQWSADGTAVITATSSASDGGAALSCGGVDGSPLYVRVKHDTSAGKVYFYTSSNGTSWAQLGVAQTTTVGSIYNNTWGLNVGAVGTAGTGSFWSGKINSVRIYNGDRDSGGTLAVDFDASRYSGGGSTLTGSTGETWTLNGNAIIHPTNIPMTTPLIELAATNICLQSNAFTTTWVQNGTPTPTQDTVGPDGATSAWTLTDNDAGVQEGIEQTITLTAAAYTCSIYIKKTVGAQSSYPVMYAYNGATLIAPVTVDTSNGIATAWTSYNAGGIPIASGFTASCESANANFWRVQFTFTGTAVGWVFRFYPAATTNATQSTGLPSATVTGSAVIYGAQVELGSKATSYIPTTTGSATRNADQLYYTGALIGNLKSIALRGFKRDTGFSNTGVTVGISNAGSANDAVQMFLSSATAYNFQGLVGGVSQWNQAASNAYTPGSLSNAAQSFATNDIKMAKGGVAQTPDTVATVPTVSRLEYGMVAGAFQMNGYPGKVYAWSRNLSQSELNAVSA